MQNRSDIGVSIHATIATSYDMKAWQHGRGLRKFSTYDICSRRCHYLTTTYTPAHAARNPTACRDARRRTGSIGRPTTTTAAWARRQEKERLSAENVTEGFTTVSVCASSTGIPTHLTCPSSRLQQGTHLKPTSSSTLNPNVPAKKRRTKCIDISAQNTR